MNTDHSAGVRYPDKTTTSFIWITEQIHYLGKTGWEWRNYAPGPDDGLCREIVDRIRLFSVWLFAIISTPFVFGVCFLGHYVEIGWSDLTSYFKEPLFHPHFDNVPDEQNAWDPFPDDTTAIICDYLTFRELLALSRVSKIFSHFVLDTALPNYLNTCNQALTSLRLNLWDMNELFNLSGDKIHRLSLRENDYYGINEHPIRPNSRFNEIGPEWIKQCPNLRHAALENLIEFRPFKPFIEALALSKETLTSLSIECFNLTAQDATQLVDLFKKLTRLDFKDHYNDDSASCLKVFTEGLPGLTALNYQPKKLRRDDLENIVRNLPQLTSLDLGDVDAAKSTIMAFEAAPTNLKRLLISHLNGSLMNPTIASNLSQLTSLRMSWSKLDAGSLTILLRPLHNLDSLDLSGNQFGDKGVAVISQYAPNLKFLSLRICKIKEKGISIIAQSFTCLTTLALAGNHLRYAEVKPLLEQQTKLQYFSFTMNHTWSEENVEDSLAHLSNFKSLLSLKVTNIKISDNDPTQAQNQDHFKSTFLNYRNSYGKFPNCHLTFGIESYF